MPRGGGGTARVRSVGSFASTATIRAGAPSVFQTSWNATPSSGSSRLTGTGPSDRTTETPSGVWPVTTRRGTRHAWVTIGPPWRATISGHRPGMVSGDRRLVVGVLLDVRAVQVAHDPLGLRPVGVRPAGGLLRRLERRQARRRTTPRRARRSSRRSPRGRRGPCPPRRRGRPGRGRAAAPRGEVAHLRTAERKPAREPSRKIGWPPENARSPANMTLCSGSQTPTSLVVCAGPITQQLDRELVEVQRHVLVGRSLRRPERPGRRSRRGEHVGRLEPGAQHALAAQVVPDDRRLAGRKPLP